MNGWVIFHWKFSAVHHGSDHLAKAGSTDRWLWGTHTNTPRRKFTALLTYLRLGQNNNKKMFLTILIHGFVSHESKSENDNFNQNCLSHNKENWLKIVSLSHFIVNKTHLTVFENTKNVAFGLMVFWRFPPILNFSGQKYFLNFSAKKFVRITNSERWFVMFDFICVLLIYHFSVEIR